MSRVPRVPVQPDDEFSIAEQQKLVIETIDDEIEFGEPLDPRDPTSVVLAGSGTPTVHNGTRSNILGSWVELVIDGSQGNAIGDPITCHHNLYQEQPDTYTAEIVTDEPNCRWSVWGWQHIGLSGAEGTVYEDLRVSPTATRLVPGSFGPDTSILINDGAGSIGVWVEAFDDVRDEMVTFPVQIPHSYKPGTPIEAHVHWTPLVPGAGTPDDQVSWVLEYTWANRGDIFQPTAFVDGDDHVPDDAIVVLNRHYVTNLGNIYNTGDFSPGELSSMLICRLWRDAVGAVGTDNLAGDVGLLEIDFHYQIGGHGSDGAEDMTPDFELRDRPFNIMRLENDNITANTIDLRIYASPFLLVDDKAPLKVTLFFIKATR